MRSLLFFLLFTLIFPLYLSADYLNTKDSNHCAYDVEPNDNAGWDGEATGLCYTDRNDDRDECDDDLEFDDLIDGYYLNDDDKCVLKHNLRITGLSQSAWYSMMAILGHVLGFTTFFLISFLSILVARR